MFVVQFIDAPCREKGNTSETIYSSVVVTSIVSHSSHKHWRNQLSPLSSAYLNTAMGYSMNEYQGFSEYLERRWVSVCSPSDMSLVSPVSKLLVWVLSATRLATTCENESISGARSLTFNNLVQRSFPIMYSDPATSFMIQAFLKHASALGRSSGPGCRMLRRKLTQRALRSMFSTTRGEEDAIRAYFHTSTGSLNKGLPVTILYKMHPRDQMLPGWSWVAPCHALQAPCIPMSQ